MGRAMNDLRDSVRDLKRYLVEFRNSTYDALRRENERLHKDLIATQDELKSLKSHIESTEYRASSEKVKKLDAADEDYTRVMKLEKDRGFAEGYGLAVAQLKGNGTTQSF